MRRFSTPYTRGTGKAMWFLYTDGMCHMAPALQQMRIFTMLEDNPALGHAAIALFDAEVESKAMLRGKLVSVVWRGGGRVGVGVNLYLYAVCLCAKV